MQTQFMEYNYFKKVMDYFPSNMLLLIYSHVCYKLNIFSTIIFINTIILPYKASSCVLQSLTLTAVFKGKSIQREWVIIWDNPISNKQTISATRSSKGKSMSFPRYIFFEIKLMWYFFNNIAIVYNFGNYLWRLFSEPVAT